MKKVRKEGRRADKAYRFFIPFNTGRTVRDPKSTSRGRVCTASDLQK